MDEVETERRRIADWLEAKADETEALLKVAAERCEDERAAWNKLFAIKTRVLIHVLAEMIRRDRMTLAEPEKEPAT